MTRPWVIATAAIGVMTAATAHLAFVAHVTAAYVALVLLLVLLVTRVHIGVYVAWLSRPGHRSLKVLVSGGPLAWVHDRSGGRSSFVRLLLGGPDLLLVPDEDEPPG